MRKETPANKLLAFPIYENAVTRRLALMLAPSVKQYLSVASERIDATIAAGPPGTLPKRKPAARCPYYSGTAQRPN
jgi:hypothetical protein